MRFCNKMRPKMNGDNIFEDSKKIGAAWQKLSLTEKKKYNKAAASGWGDWKKKVAQYRKSDEYAQHKENVKKAKEKRLGKRENLQRTQTAQNAPPPLITSSSWKRLAVARTSRHVEKRGSS